MFLWERRGRIRPRSVDTKDLRMLRNRAFAAIQKGSGLMAKKSEGLSYGVGDRVRHVKFGDGTVTEIKEGGRDYEVTVQFDTAGVRKMFALFAKLIKI